MWSVSKMAQSKYVAICLFAHGNSCVNLLQWCKYLFVEDIIEPRQDKTNKVTLLVAKTQISLGIRPDWSESPLSAWRKLGSLATH